MSSSRKAGSPPAARSAALLSKGDGDESCLFIMPSDVLFPLFGPARSEHDDEIPALVFGLIEGLVAGLEEMAQGDVMKTLRGSPTAGNGHLEGSPFGLEKL